MRKILVVLTMVLSAQAQAQDLFGGSSSQPVPQAVGGSETAGFRALLGFTQGAINIGAEYESRKSNIRSIGGYFFNQTEKEGVTNQVMAFGGYMPLHVLSKNIVDLYVAPGFGLAMVKVGGQTQTGIGPSLKIGAEYRTSATMSWGLQYGTYYNWFSDKAPAGAEYSSAAMTILF